jgi:hypothetical protein
VDYEKQEKELWFWVLVIAIKFKLKLLITTKQYENKHKNDTAAAYVFQTKDGFLVGAGVVLIYEANKLHYIIMYHVAVLLCEENFANRNSFFFRRRNS